MPVWNVLESFNNGNLPYEKEAEIGEGPGNTCVIRKTGKESFPELHSLQLVESEVRLGGALVRNYTSLVRWMVDSKPEIPTLVCPPLS